MVLFSYCFLFEKPVITLDIPKHNLTEFEADDMKEFWDDKVNRQIGALVDENNINQLNEIVNETLKKTSSDHIISLRNETIANWSNSSEKVVEYLLEASAREK